MYEELDGDLEARRSRRFDNSRMKSPKASRLVRQKKRSPQAGTIGGTHRRRNKHWSW